MDHDGAVWGIVLAAGTGRRFGARKQFAALSDGTRVVDRVVATTARACDDVVVVLPPGNGWDGQPVTRVVAGGTTRSDSVRAALAAVPRSAAIVVVHGVSHPWASPALFEAVLGAVRAGADAAAPGLRPADVVARTAAGRVVDHLGREDLVLVQSPCAYRAAVLRAAHASRTGASEDVELVRSVGAQVVVVPGEATNLHLVTAAELALLEGVDPEVLRPR
jgi:2-C-methyl-D-erythritol 4-phosphate cytidylyltransferase